MKLCNVSQVFPMFIGVVLETKIVDTLTQLIHFGAHLLNIYIHTNKGKYTNMCITT